MTWLGQVWHIARKDVQEESWPLVAYLGVTALAAVVVFVQRGIDYSNILAFIVFLFGMILTTAVVQSDSPTASESFWGSRPFSPTAMLGAKVLLAAIIVLIPSIAQGIALSVFRANAGDAALAIANSAKVYALSLLLVMAIAGLTRDIQSFIVAFASILVAFTLATVIGSQVWEMLAPPAPETSSAQFIAATSQSNSLVGPILWTIVAVSSAVALLAFLYRRRDARRRIWIAAIAVAGVIAAAGFTDKPTVAHAATAASIPIRVELLRSDGLGREDHMGFQVRASIDTVSRRLVLAVDRVIVRLKDGTAVTVRGMVSSTALVTLGNPLAGSVRLLGGDKNWSSSFALGLSMEQVSAISKGVTGLELAGTVFIFEPRMIGMLPMEANRSLMRDGTRLRIASVNPAPDGGTVVAQLLALPRTESFPFAGRIGGSGDRDYALVNQARGELVYPNRTGGFGASTPLVLVSMPLTTNSSTLELKSFEGAALDAAWFMGARLALIEWTLRGQYNVRVPIVEVPTPPEMR